jgi:hypothetical protein
MYNLGITTSSLQYPECKFHIHNSKREENAIAERNGPIGYSPYGTQFPLFQQAMAFM